MTDLAAMPDMNPGGTTHNHTLCERCWFVREPFRFPVQVVREPGDLTWDVCCFCGTPKVTRIGIRIDPESQTLQCGGVHIEWVPVEES